MKKASAASESLRLIQSAGFHFGHSQTVGHDFPCGLGFDHELWGKTEPDRQSRLRIFEASVVEGVRGVGRRGGVGNPIGRAARSS